MTDEEVRALAERHSETLENALKILKVFQDAAEQLGGSALGIADRRKLQQRRADAESAWNRASGAIGDAVRAAGVQAQTTLSEGRAIDTIPNALFHSNLGYPFIQRARGIVEAAAGRWEEYTAHPERFPRPEGAAPNDNAPDVPEPAPLPPIESSKVPLSRILSDMTATEWVGLLFVFGTVVTGTAWVVNWANGREIDDANRERDQCAADLKLARADASASATPVPTPVVPTPVVTAPAPSSASSSAP